MSYNHTPSTVSNDDDVSSDQNPPDTVLSPYNQRSQKNFSNISLQKIVSKAAKIILYRYNWIHRCNSYHVMWLCLTQTSPKNLPSQTHLVLQIRDAWGIGGPDGIAGSIKGVGFLGTIPSLHMRLGAEYRALGGNWGIGGPDGIAGSLGLLVSRHHPVPTYAATSEQRRWGGNWGLVGGRDCRVIRVVGFLGTIPSLHMRLRANIGSYGEMGGSVGRRIAGSLGCWVSRHHPVPTYAAISEQQALWGIGNWWADGIAGSLRVLVYRHHPVPTHAATERAAGVAGNLSD